MNEARFTKGPLTVVENQGGSLTIHGVVSDRVPNPSELFTVPTKRELTFGIDDDGKLCVHIAYDRWVQFPETNPFGVDWNEMQRANAYLFAAAPDLYDALSRIMHYANTGAAVCDRARAVLAKARGENEEVAE